MASSDSSDSRDSSGASKSNGACGRSRSESSGTFEGDDDPGLSLDELSQAYAELLGEGEDPYQKAQQPANPDALAGEWDEEDAEEEAADAREDVDGACEISPRSVLEAMLFVGHPANEPLTSRQVAALMRGVSPREIEELVEELNEEYAAAAAPYAIVSVDAGYQLRLRDEYAGLRDRFFGRVKAAKLSQPALDVLAIIAYCQGSTRDDVDRLRAGASSSALLRQLVRRQLLRVERSSENARVMHYYTTDRFLDLLGLDSLDDLPQSEA